MSGDIRRPETGAEEPYPPGRNNRSSCIDESTLHQIQTETSIQ